MSDSNFINEINKRRTFAIISHPDAGKTTVTEQLLWHGGAIQQTGTVKGRKATRHARSDWMELEKERGISVTSSVMQFVYRERIVNLLDTPGHEDFSEDTYRTLTAVDSALMVIDVAKGVEARTIKLMDVCRLRDTPIITLINKLDREGRDPLDLLDEVERVLSIECVPMTWPVGMGKELVGIYHLVNRTVRLYRPEEHGLDYDSDVLPIDDSRLRDILGSRLDDLLEEIELVQGAGNDFDEQAYLAGKQTPVFFGTALNNFGIEEMLDCFVEYAPAPLPREATSRLVEPTEEAFSGFVFKIQANMDPSHRDRIAFLRVSSGRYHSGMKMRHVRLDRDVQISNAVTFLAGERGKVDEAWAGDIIGLHNHGTIQIGDTFSAGEKLKYTGVPHFAPELFRRAVLKDPLRMKALLKGLVQLSEEGATQVFRPLSSNELILGAVGILQFDVVAWRLENEYKVECKFEPIQVATARWVYCDDPVLLEQFKRKASDNLALDGSESLTYIAPTRVNLDLTIERWPDIEFRATREH